MYVRICIYIVYILYMDDVYVYIYIYIVYRGYVCIIICICIVYRGYMYVCICIYILPVKSFRHNINSSVHNI